MAVIVAEAAPVRPGAGWVGSLAVTLLQVWAPAARSVGAVVDGVRRAARRPPTAGGGGPTYRLAGHGTDYGFLLDDDADAAARPALAAGSRTGCTGRRRVYDHDRFAWTDAGWRGRRRCRARSSTSCTSAPSPPEGTLDAAIERLDHLVDARRRPRRADAGRRLPGTARLGVRRRAPVRRARALRRPGRAQALRRRLPPARARGLPRRRLQPPRARPGTTCRGSGPTSPTSTTRRGARRSTSTTTGAAEVRRWIIDNALDVAARLPRRRAAAGRRARAGRRLAGAPAGRAVARGRRAVRARYAGRWP